MGWAVLSLRAMPHSSFSSQSEAMYSILSLSIISSLLLLSSAEPCPDRKFEILKTVSVALLQDVVFRKKHHEENFLNFHFVSPICQVMCWRIYSSYSFISEEYIPPLAYVTIYNRVCSTSCAQYGEEYLWCRYKICTIYYIIYVCLINFCVVKLCLDQYCESSKLYSCYVVGFVL